MEARPMVTAGLKCAPLKLPTAYTATVTPNAQPAVMTIHPAFWPLVLLSTTLATTPSPRTINSMVPSSSERKGGIGSNKEAAKLSARQRLVYGVRGVNGVHGVAGSYAAVPIPYTRCVPCRGACAASAPAPGLGPDASCSHDEQRAVIGQPTVEWIRSIRVAAQHSQHCPCLREQRLAPFPQRPRSNPLRSPAAQG